MIQPTRATQPYRRGQDRPQTDALQAMQAGRTASGYNPQDQQRLLYRRSPLSKLLAERLRMVGIGR